MNKLEKLLDNKPVFVLLNIIVVITFLGLFFVPRLSVAAIIIELTLCVAWTMLR